MMPTTVISAPLAHHERVVTSALDAPTTKCASVLMMNEAITAGMPTVKKNGMIGMKPPIAVDTLADSVDRHGLGNVSSESPSSSCTSVAQELLRLLLQPLGHRRALLRRENPFS